MPAVSSSKPYRVGRSRTGLGLFATRGIRKGDNIIRYVGPLLDEKKCATIKKNKYLFGLDDRWIIDGSARENTARYINHACEPNATADVDRRQRKVMIRAIRNIEPGEEITFHYGSGYFHTYLGPSCKCDACERGRQRGDDLADRDDRYDRQDFDDWEGD